MHCLLLQFSVSATVLIFMTGLLILFKRNNCNGIFNLENKEKLISNVVDEGITLENTFIGFKTVFDQSIERKKADFRKFIAQYKRNYNLGFDQKNGNFDAFTESYMRFFDMFSNKCSNMFAHFYEINLKEWEVYMLSKGKKNYSQENEFLIELTKKFCDFISKFEKEYDEFITKQKNRIESFINPLGFFHLNSLE